MTVQRARSAYTENITRLSTEAATPSPVSSLFRTPTALLATAAEGQREALSFVAARLEKDSDAVREAAGCRNWTEALELQRRWLQEMITDYTAEATKMLSLYARSGQPDDNHQGR